MTPSESPQEEPTLLPALGRTRSSLNARCPGDETVSTRLGSGPSHETDEGGWGAASVMGIDIPLGSIWEVSPSRPLSASSREIVNAELADALLHDRTAFTPEEMDLLGISEVHPDSFVTIGLPGHERYFRPVKLTAGGILLAWSMRQPRRRLSAWWAVGTPPSSSTEMAPEMAPEIVTETALPTATWDQTWVPSVQEEGQLACRSSLFCPTNAFPGYGQQTKERALYTAQRPPHLPPVLEPRSPALKMANLAPLPLGRARSGSQAAPPRASTVPAPDSLDVLWRRRTGLATPSANRRVNERLALSRLLNDAGSPVARLRPSQLRGAVDEFWPRPATQARPMPRIVPTMASPIVPTGGSSILQRPSMVTSAAPSGLFEVNLSPWQLVERGCSMAVGRELR